MRFFYAFSLATVAIPIMAAPVAERRVIHEQRHVNIQPMARVDPNAMIPLRIGLKQSNIQDTYAQLMKVSDPSSGDYGKHLTVDEVDSMYAPSSQTILAVISWLVATGIRQSQIHRSDNKAWLAVNLPAWQIESLLDAEYYEYGGDSEGDVRIGCDRYDGCSAILHLF